MKDKLQQYLDNLQGKRVAVIGIGVSNTPLIRLLLQAGIAVTACDKNDRASFGSLAEELEELGAQLQLGEHYLDNLDQDVVFRTPGMHPNTPALRTVRERGNIVTSEMEVFFEVCPCHTIGITGSDGKTTTTTMVSSLLKAAGHTTFVGGNIGRPLLADVPQMKAEDWAVLELSSFQLMTMTHSPEIAVVTNLAPNHLDVHVDMEEYVAAKANIFAHQTAEDRVILNRDNQITWDFAAQAKGRLNAFSRQSAVEQGTYLKDEIIWMVNANGQRPVLAVGDILLPGIHNVENFMTAIAAVDGLVPDEVIRTFAKEFGGVEHRIELVRQVQGVRYYNDSIASSPSRTIAGLRSFSEKVILIAGGYDKHIPFAVLGPEVIDHVKHLILTGDTAEKIKTAVLEAPGYAGQPPIELVNDMAQAVHRASDIASEGDVVILSPACASFDRYKNFAQRGIAFKELVQTL